MAVAEDHIKTWEIYGTASLVSNVYWLLRKVIYAAILNAIFKQFWHRVARTKKIENEGVTLTQKIFLDTLPKKILKIWKLQWIKIGKKDKKNNYLKKKKKKKKEKKKKEIRKKEIRNKKKRNKK